MHLIGEKMKEFFTKNRANIISLLTILLSLFGYDQVTDGFKPKDSLSENDIKVITEIVDAKFIAYQDVINKKFDNLNMQFYNADIDELSLALAEVRTGLEVDELVQYWIDEGWTKKLTAIQRISEYKKARDELQDRLYSEEVFKTLMTYAK